MSLFRRGPGRVDPAEADRRTAEGDAVLLDVREDAEWNAGHAPHAVHLPLSRLVEGVALPGDLEGRAVVAVCRSGNRSQKAARLLAARGVDAVDVTGGMAAWEREGLPVHDGRGRPGTVA
jgi:rhodanese-related sulfurtransferase